MYYGDEYLFGGGGIGNLSTNTLTNHILDDPYRANKVRAVQHPSTDANEQWADIFANVMANNIGDTPQGLKVWEWLFSNAVPILMQ